MSDSSFWHQPPPKRHPSIVPLIVVAALVSAVAVTTGGAIVAPTIALASTDRISLAALVRPPMPASLGPGASGHAPRPRCGQSG
jgi:hypothetical protein